MNKTSLLYFYYQYKDSLLFHAGVSFIIVIVCSLLVVKVIFPQVENWFSISREINSTKQRIANIKSNSAYVAGISDERLDEEFVTVAAALPEGKDFSGIIQAITVSSINSGVILDDFSFQIGEIASKSASVQESEKTEESPIKISLSITGEVEKVKQFVRELIEKVPLINVETIETNTTSDGSTRVALEFYYKPFPTIPYDEAITLKQLSTKDRETIQQLSDFKAKTQIIDLEELSATSSSLPAPF